MTRLKIEGCAVEETAYLSFCPGGMVTHYLLVTIPQDNPETVMVSGSNATLYPLDIASVLAEYERFPRARNAETFNYREAFNGHYVKFVEAHCHCTPWTAWALIQATAEWLFVIGRNA